MVEHLPGEREVLGTGLPERRQLVVEHRVAEQAADEALLALHRREVAGGVPAGEGHADDQVVQDEVVQDDDSGLPAQRLDDPAVRLGVVADVVETDVRSGVTAEPAGTGDDDVDPLLERRQEQRGIVRDPGP